MSRPTIRTRMAPDERRSQLVRCAAQIFERNGYDRVSVEDIAAEAGVSPALVHHYLESKN